MVSWLKRHRQPDDPVPSSPSPDESSACTPIPNPVASAGAGRLGVTPVCSRSSDGSAPLLVELAPRGLPKRGSTVAVSVDRNAFTADAISACGRILNASCAGGAYRCTRVFVTPDWATITSGPSEHGQGLPVVRAGMRVPTARFRLACVDIRCRYPRQGGKPSGTDSRLGQRLLGTRGIEARAARAHHIQGSSSLAPDDCCV